MNLRKGDRLNISIPIDQKTAIEARLSLKDQIKSLSEKLSLPVLIVSLLLALFALWVSLTLFSEILVVLYVLIIIFRKRKAKLSTENWGVTFDSRTRKPVSGIPIKVFDKKYGSYWKHRLVMTGEIQLRFTKGGLLSSHRFFAL